MHPGMGPDSPPPGVGSDLGIIGGPLLGAFVLPLRDSLVLLVRAPGFFDSCSDLSTKSRSRLKGSDLCINDGLGNLVVLEVRKVSGTKYVLVLKTNHNISKLMHIIQLYTHWTPVICLPPAWCA